MLVENREWTIPRVVLNRSSERSGGQHALIGDGLRGQRGEVDPQPVLGALAQPPGTLVQGPGGGLLERVGVLIGQAQEELPEVRHGLLGQSPDHRGVDGHLAPAQDLQALLCDHVLQGGAHLEPLVLGLRQEGGAGGVLSGGGQLEVHHGPEELVRDLGQQARAVAGADVSAHGAAVLEVAQRDQRVVDDVMARLTAQGSDSGHAAVLVLVGRVIETGLLWIGGKAHKGADDAIPWCLCAQTSGFRCGNGHDGVPSSACERRWGGDDVGCDSLKSLRSIRARTQPSLRFLAAPDQIHPPRPVRVRQIASQDVEGEDFSSVASSSEPASSEPSSESASSEVSAPFSSAGW